MSDKAEVTIVGAGIVGICCALYLRREGYPVTLIDAEGPGEGASSGNAGLIADGSCLPISLPGMAARVPAMLMDPLGPLTIRWGHLPRLAPWLARFLAAGGKDRVEAISAAMHALYRHALADLEPLVKEARAENLLRREGRLEVFRTEASFEKTAFTRELQRRRGVDFEILEAGAIRELEPALAQPMAKGIRFPSQGHTTDPLALCRALAEHFEQKGGTILRERVTGIEMGAGGPRAIETEGGRRPVALLVLAAGAFSRRLAARLGSRLPLDTERGYHVMLPNPGIEVRRPLISGDHKFAITPMDGGLRLAGTVELAGLTAPPNYARADRLVEAARTVFGEIDTRGATRWMGFRPSMPDSLPVIGRAPRHNNVFFAFGHGHLGLTGAGTTGRLIADLVAGRQPAIDLTPYRPERF